MVSGTRVLELGFGAGANIPFFLNSGVEYWGIEGSGTIVSKIRDDYPELDRRLFVGDFTAVIEPPGQFDLILDRASLTHNPTSAIRRALEIVRQRLTPQGIFLGVDWFSTEFNEFLSGRPGEDEYTRVDFDNGRLQDTGLAHFCDEAHLRDLLSAYEISFLEHKTMTQVAPANEVNYAAWNLVAKNVA